MSFKQKTLIADLTCSQSVEQVISCHPVGSSQSAQWHGLFFSHYHHFTYESPTHQWTQHLIGITSPGYSVPVEHRLDNQLHQHHYQGGEILIIPTGVSYWSFWQQEAEFSLLGISPQFFEQIAHESIRADQIELIPKVAIFDPLIQQIAVSLHSDLLAGHPVGTFFGDSLATALVAQLLQNHVAWKAYLPSNLGGLPKYKLTQALDFIESHLDQSFTLAQVAEALGMSLYHFCRQFKQSTGVAPHQYITRQRLDRAKQLLRHSQLPITDIALQVGFATPSAFTRLFRRITGTTPKYYRNQQ
ncbi:helix-turn-helix domain-containing protein [Nostoc sp. MS1]|uniref:AraC family transcriptional regulator n=1 Tax=Nostoc sp. MS1 TaxID=2764711 RepID=UPI001CC61027|nr:AraC family transcriptional regulator [Nostoc sp. MS1]BCL35272.1 AraC family transcriptional regulator [Nostoc sp. MS1]